MADDHNPDVSIWPGLIEKIRARTPARVLDRVNGSKHRPYQEYYDKDLIGWVSELYQKDLELFGYAFE